MAGTGSMDQTGGRNKFPLWDFKKLKKVRNNSTTIRVLGFLWILGAIINPLLGIALLLGEDTNLFMGMVSLAMGVLAAIASFGAITRPEWGKIPGMILCVIILLGFPIGTLIGTVGLVAFSEKEHLFGEGRISHADLNDEYRHRKRNRIN